MPRAPDDPAVLALTEAIAAGDVDALGRFLDADPEHPHPDTVTGALWHACRVGSASAVTVLLRAGGEPDWLGWDDLTPGAAAEQGGHAGVVAVLDGLA